MVKNNTLNGIKVEPRLLTQRQAAAYCGVSISTLKNLCPVRPIALGASKRLERYDIHQLDQWIDTFCGRDPARSTDWLAVLDSSHDRDSNKGD